VVCVLGVRIGAIVCRWRVLTFIFPRCVPMPSVSSYFLALGFANVFRSKGFSSFLFCSGVAAQAAVLVDCLSVRSAPGVSVGARWPEQPVIESIKHVVYSPCAHRARVSGIGFFNLYFWQTAREIVSRRHG